MATMAGSLLIPDGYAEERWNAEKRKKRRTVERTNGRMDGILPRSPRQLLILSFSVPPSCLFLMLHFVLLSSLARATSARLSLSLPLYEDSRREREAASRGIRRGFRHYTPTSPSSPVSSCISLLSLSPFLISFRAPSFLDGRAAPMSRVCSRLRVSSLFSPVYVSSKSLTCRANVTRYKDEARYYGYVVSFPRWVTLSLSIRVIRKNCGSHSSYPASFSAILRIFDYYERAEERTSV